MTDAGFIEIVKRLLAQNTRKGARDIVAKVGDDYRALAGQLAERIEYKRTKKQNNLIHQWFGEVAEHMGEEEDWVKAREKYEIGLPIIFKDDPDEIDRWKRFMAPLNYEARIYMMMKIPLTSLLDTKQMALFSDEFEKKWRMRGVRLTIPEMAK